MNTITFTTLKTKVCQFIIRLERFAGLSPQKANVLFYHSISNDKTLIDVSIRDFEKQIMYLKKNFTFVPLETILSYLKGGVILTKPSIALTFDDGYYDLLKNVVPILKRYNIPATVFVIAQPAFVNKAELANDKKLLALSQVKKLVKYGWGVGSHTLTHPNLLTLSSTYLLNELKESKRILEDILQVPVATIAYPKGLYDKRVLKLTKEAGYRAGFTTDWGTLKPNETDFIQIPRIGVDHTYSLAQFPMLFTRSIIYYFTLKVFLYRNYVKAIAIVSKFFSFLSQLISNKKVYLEVEVK